MNFITNEQATQIPTDLLYSLKESPFYPYKMVFELNFNELAHKIYDLFSKDMQNTWNQCKCYSDRLLEMAT